MSLAPLTVIPYGQKVIIRELRGGYKFKKRLADMGIYPEIEVTVLSSPEDSFIMLKKGDVKVGIGPGMAHKIFVEIEKN